MKLEICKGLHSWELLNSGNKFPANFNIDGIYKPFSFSLYIAQDVPK